MSLQSAAGKLRHAGQELALRWAAARELWRDDNARRFESEIVENLLTRLRAVEAALTHMDAVLQKVRRDCE